MFVLIFENAKKKKIIMRETFLTVRESRVTILNKGKINTMLTTRIAY